MISKKQATRSRSSTEAEIKAYNTCAATISYINNILQNVFLLDVDEPVIMEGDNKGAIACVTGPSVTQNLLHVENQYWYPRHMYADKKMVVVWCNTDQLLADALTKPLPPDKFLKFRKRLLGEDDQEDLVRTLIFPNNHEQTLNKKDNDISLLYENKAHS